MPEEGVCTLNFVILQNEAKASSNCLNISTLAKAYLLPPERPPFTLQYAAFYTLKGYLLQSRWFDMRK